MWTRDQVARTIDHSILKPNLTDADVVEGCCLARDCGVIAVCVRPTDVRTAVRELAGSSVRTACTVGFPHGANRSEVKATEARLALEDGAVELDMVMNVGKFLSGNHSLVVNDIAAVVSVAHARSALVKVILETGYLTYEQVSVACRLAEAAGADFVKTSTGFSSGGATVEDIALMRETVGPEMGVKASGGVGDLDKARSMMAAGATRIGASASVSIVTGKMPPAKGY